MTLKQKAKQLVDGFVTLNYEHASIGEEEYGMSYEYHKKCALKCVDIEYDARVKAYKEMEEFCPDVASQAIIYAEKERQQLKEEINKL